MPRKLDRCRSCQVTIFWAITDKRKRMPIDLEPDPSGNLVIEEIAGIVYCHVTKQTQAMLGEENAPELYLSHFATCPVANANRRHNKPRTRAGIADARSALKGD